MSSPLVKRETTNKHLNATIVTLYSQPCVFLVFSVLQLKTHDLLSPSQHTGIPRQIKLGALGQSSWAISSHNWKWRFSKKNSCSPMLYNHNKPPPTSMFNHDNSNIHRNGMHWPWARVTYMQVKSRRRNKVWNFIVSHCFSADKKKASIKVEEIRISQAETAPEFQRPIWTAFSAVQMGRSSSSQPPTSHFQSSTSFETLGCDRIRRKAWSAKETHLLAPGDLLSLRRSFDCLSTGGASTLLCVCKNLPSLLHQPLLLLPWDVNNFYKLWVKV